MVSRHQGKGYIFEEKGRAQGEKTPTRGLGKHLVKKKELASKERWERRDNFKGRHEPGRGGPAPFPSQLVLRPLQEKVV